MNKLEIEKICEYSGHKNPVYTLETAPAGRFFSAGGDQLVVQWNIDDPSLGEAFIQLKHTIYTLKFITNKNLICVGTAEGGIHIFDVNTKEELKYIQFPNDSIFHMEEDEANIYASSVNGKLICIHKHDLSISFSIQLCNEKIRRFKIDSNHMYIACSDSYFYVFDLESQKIITRIQAHQWAVNAIYVTKSKIITGGRDAHIRIWDKENYTLIKSIPAHHFAIYDIQFHNELNVFTTISRDKSIKIWDENFEFLKKINVDDGGHINSVNSMIWIGNSLISGGDDRRIIRWKVN